MKRHSIDAILESVPTLIYDATHRVRWHRRLARELATALFWAAWVYWMLPILTLFAWAAGAHVAYGELFSDGNMEHFVYVLPRYALVILMISLISVNWAGLQLWSRRGRERRLPVERREVAEIARSFGVSREMLHKAHQSRIVVAVHDEDGRVVSIDAHAPRAFPRERKEG